MYIIIVDKIKDVFFKKILQNRAQNKKVIAIIMARPSFLIH
jgi:hypothetical protein